MIGPDTDNGRTRHITETPDNTSKKQEFRGIFGENPNILPEDDIFTLAEQAAQSSPLCLPEIYIACGTEDHLYPESVRLNQHLQQLPYHVQFEQWEGIHNWGFWDCAVNRILEYFFVP